MTLTRYMAPEEKLFIPCTREKNLGVTTLPQDMFITKKMELLGCIHQSNSKTVINGILYIVDRWDDRFVYLNVHPRYQKQPGDDSDKDDKEEEEKSEEDESRPIVVDPSEGEIPTDLKLSHAKVSRWLRLTHARCYGSIQGCTMEGQKLMLIDTRAKYFTTRHLIVGVSRATDQKDVHVASEKEEKSWMDDARLQFSIPMQGGTDQSLFTEDDYDETNDLALYYNDPDYDDSSNDLALYCNDFDDFHPIETAVQLQSDDEDDGSRDLALYFNDPDDYPEAVVAPVDEFDEDGDVIM